jgi:hypothetical protein
VLEAYKSVPKVKGLYSRDRNKFKPLLALAMVIDDETNKKWNLFDLLSDYGVEYRKNRKQDVTDLEEVLLKVILEWNIRSATFNQLARRMHKEGFKKYGWQTARLDLKKLGIVKLIDRRKKPAVVHINLTDAKKRAEQRGIEWNSMGSPTDYDDEEDTSEDYDDEYNDSEEEYDEGADGEYEESELTGDLSNIQREIIKIIGNPAHQRVDGAVMVSNIVDIIEALYEVDRGDVEAMVDDLRDMNKIYEPSLGFVKLKK